MIEFRAPSKKEMSRWLVTLNLHSFTMGGNQSTASGATGGLPAAGAPLVWSTTGTRAEERKRGLTRAHQAPRKPTVAVVDVDVSKYQLVMDSKELMVGWLSVKKDKAGLKKKRYCRLVLATEADGTGNVLQRATLYATAKPGDAVTSGEKIEVRRRPNQARGRTLNPSPSPNPSSNQVWRAISVEARQDKKNPKPGGPLQFVLRLPETRPTDIGTAVTTASTSKLGQTFSLYAEQGGAAWLEAIRAQVGAAKFLGREKSVPVDDATVPPAYIDLFRSPAARSFVTPDGAPLKAGWVELIDFSSFSETERRQHALQEADRSFTMVYLVLWPSRELAYFEDEDTNAPPLGARCHSAQREGAASLKEGPYNYEHAFSVPMSGAELAGVAKCGDTWWICADSPVESNQWTAVLNGVESQSTRRGYVVEDWVMMPGIALSKG